VAQPPNAVTAASNYQAYVLHPSTLTTTGEYTEQNFPPTGPSPPTPRIRHNLQVEEERLQSIRRIEVQQLRAGQDRASFPDRGAEDREEGAEGDGDEDCGQEMSVMGAWILRQCSWDSA
jgi:hypothetical protein